MLTLLLKFSPRKIVSRIFLAALFIILFFAGHYEVILHKEIGLIYHWLFSLLDQPDAIYRRLDEYNLGDLTQTGRRLIKISSIALYCSLSLVIIQLCFLNLSVTKIVFWLYIIMTAIFFMLYFFSHWLHIEPLLMMAIRIENLMTSPIPILLLIPALHLATPTRQ
jgi:hypothetical protein